MQEFKVGDWVNYAGEFYRVHEEYNGKGNISKEVVNSLVRHNKNVKLWQPKPEDYLWDKQFGLSLAITNPHKGKLQCKAVFGYKETFFAKYNKDCEPFIGELPTFLQRV